MRSGRGFSRWELVKGDDLKKGDDIVDFPRCCYEYVIVMKMRESDA